MSQSLDNYIAIEDPPGEMFDKIMSISDDLKQQYYELLTTADVAAISRIHPMEAKLRLAHEIVARYHGAGPADEARAEFQHRFRAREFPTDTAERTLLPKDANSLVAMVVGSGLAPSKTEARRLIAQGGVEVNGEKVTDSDRVFPNEARQEYRLKVGKKRFAIVRFGD